MPLRVHRSERNGGDLNRRMFIMGLPALALSLDGCANTSTRLESGGPAYRIVQYETRERPGTIIVDPTNHFLYLLQGGGQALQYDVGVGKEGYGWSGFATVHDKREWPDWYPTREYLERRPEIRSAMTELQSGLGMRGGPENPMGARALYLWQGRADTLYRIHGTNEPDTVGHDVSAGCIRMRNEDVVDLYNRTPVGTKVIVLGAHSA